MAIQQKLDTVAAAQREEMERLLGRAMEDQKENPKKPEEE